MSLRILTFVLVTFLAAVSEAALPGRTLQSSVCDRACRAARRTDPTTLERIIEEGQSICNCRCNRRGWKPMHISVQSKCLFCIGNMTAAPSNCMERNEDNKGNTVLHVGASLCERRVMDKLLHRYNFSPDPLNYDNDTPLCIAALQDAENCDLVARQLMEYGAEKCFRCSNGKTPCDGCVNRNVCNVLRQDGACNCS